MELLASTLTSAMWPGTVLLIALVFRRELSLMAGRVARAKLPGGAELEFGAFVADELRPTPGDSSVDPASLQKQRIGNIYWLGSDLMWTYDAILRRAEGKYVLHGITQVLHHLSEVGFSGSTSEQSLRELLHTVTRAIESDSLTDAQRITAAVRIKNLAHQVGATIESHQSGFDGGLEENENLTHEERLSRIGR